ncbi:MAG: serine hydrolase, partial [Gammaproteobacteria bacterium]|nr:serine hydrolase [Gammaproteobacteria bacterium]
MEPRFEGRLVRHDPNGPFAGITSDAWIDFPFASGGLNTTARDIAEFCQVYLSDGAGLLSPASVREASQNQIPERTQGRMTSPGSGQTIEFPASYGFGWFVQGTHRFPFNGALLPVNTLAHMGFGGAAIWVDPHSATVGVSLGVVNQMPTFQMGSLQDMVIGATL